jgi:uncharacterized SAM-binding protein YcdF (DUF218 family)
MNSPSLIDALAQRIASYHILNQEVERADCILGLGTNDPRVAERAAELYLGGYAPLIVFTGGVSSWTRGLYQASEARAFADLARAKGVPEACLRIEEQASNTGENIRFSRRLLEGEGLVPRKLILVQKPYMERRTYATCKQFWPEPEIRVTSPQIGYADYPLPWLPKEEVIQIMVGDLHRIRVYPRLGFQIEQAIPDDVWEAFEKLVQLGFDKHLVPNA